MRGALPVVLAVALVACGSTWGAGGGDGAGLPGRVSPGSIPGTAGALASTLRPFVRPDGSRDVRRWPQAVTSPWNMPVGSNATYVDAKLVPSTQYGNFVEEEIIVLEPQAPLVDVKVSTADWDRNADRCVATDEVLDRVPIPPGFTTEGFVPGTPNHAAAVLMPDGRTLHHSQPFMRCDTGGPATSHYSYDTERVDSDIFGDGLRGAHGGSGLTALGGTIRLGELVPGGSIHHALKMVLDSRFLWFDSGDPTPGYRWPATKADSHTSKATYNGTVPALEMGALLALPPAFDVAALHTEPARIIATALRDYGAYVVDSSGWNADYYATEWSPEGRVIDEFAATWRYPFIEPSTETPWTRDLATILSALNVIANNAPDSKGGGGTPRAPLAPPAT